MSLAPERWEHNAGSHCPPGGQAGPWIAATDPGLHRANLLKGNTKARLIIRRGFGLHSADVIIALVMLTLAGDKPALGRQLAIA
ncbi:hypothetical protein [Streptomyces sp. NPDC017993]|uniref:hypothetical protein n=1 Tax=Streptomyces sp. NPDC017993 TaxID=3365027 RepID=UPI00379F2BCC